MRQRLEDDAERAAGHEVAAEYACEKNYDAADLKHKARLEIGGNIDDGALRSRELQQGGRIAVLSFSIGRDERIWETLSSC
jgi:hypothetical protein